MEVEIRVPCKEEDGSVTDVVFTLIDPTPEQVAKVMVELPAAVDRVGGSIKE